MIRRLLIETSTHRGAVGIADADGMLDTCILAPDQRHARDLVLEISKLLLKHEIKSNQLNRIAVSIGPGSFTGLRVGCMIGKSMAFALGCPVQAVPTFDSVASIAGENESLTIISDALQGDVYSQDWGRKDSIRVSTESVRIVSLGTIVAEGRTNLILVGEASPAFRAIENTISLEIKRVTSGQILAGLELVTRKEERHQLDPLRVEPIYLRGSSAEEKLKQTSVGR
jgi:tRNA threonylcarbamoyladenosine biosynthesis protein TsaB